MPRSPSRDLVFGLLALEHNFVSRDQLIDAFHRWNGDSARGLDQILLEMQAISPGRRRILEELLDEYPQADGSGSEQGLSPWDDRLKSHLQAIGSAGLRLSAAAVAAPECAQDSFRTLTVAGQADPGGSGSRFRILRPHARGGLGQVSVAVDRELDRQVALKEIQPRHADNLQSRSRFVQEAEITGKLEHPGIVPVYSLGHDISGRPFYAMRLIEGDSLKEAIAALHGDAALARDRHQKMGRIRELLRRFTDVCNAIAYAHSRGVLHRDLKPANIMLGPYGETLVVDWGLAKPFGESLGADAAAENPSCSLSSSGPIRLSGSSGPGDHTQAGEIVGTPAFASPEQVSGRIDLLGPATDVYGLGATLYAILTGRPPVEDADLEVVIASVRKGSIRSPRVHNAAISRPLAAICLKALAREPKDRYASARLLAEDLTRWLDDQPTLAYPEPIPLRLGRWMRKHRNFMTAAGAVLIIGLVALAAVDAMQVKANRELFIANQIKSEALASQTRAKEETEQALDLSERARNGVEAVLSFMETRVFAAARPEGETGGLGRQVTLRQALEAALPAIAPTFQNQPIIQARIRATMGKSFLELGEPQLAFEQFHQARKLLEETLGSDHPLIERCRSNVAAALAATGRLSEALEVQTRAIRKMVESLGPTHPDVIAGMNNLANFHDALGQGDQALRLREDVLRLSRSEYGDEHPETLMAMTNLASTYDTLGRTADALRLREQVLPLLMSKMGPDHPDTLRAMNNLASSFVAAGRLDEARALYEKTLARRREQLGPDHPATLLTVNNLAVVHARQGRNHRAAELEREAIALYEHKFGSGHPVALMAMQNLADNLESLGDSTQAVVLREQVLRARRKVLGDDHPDTLSSLNNLAVSYANVGRIADSTQLHEQALAKRRQQLGNDRPETLLSMNNLALAYLAQGRAAEALRLQEEVYSRESRNRGDDHPQTLLARINLARTRFKLGQGARAAEDFQAVAKVIESREQTAVATPYRLARLHALAAQALAQSNRDSEAAREAALAVRWLERFAQSGYLKAPFLESDQDLYVLHDRADFQKLLGSLLDRDFPPNPFAR